MNWANKSAFFLSCLTIVFTTIAYGAVHQPILALFYLLVVLMMILAVIDAVKVGALRLSTSYLQLPLAAGALYGFVQIIPFGYISDAAGLSGIPRTISIDPFSTQVNALHLLALFIFLAVVLVTLDSAARIRKLVSLILVFGFVFAFYAILQSVLSPNKIYGIYETRFAVPFGSFVNRHNFAAYMEMTISLPLGMLFGGAVKRDRRLLYITSVSLMGIALLLSGSRGGFVALTAEIIILLVLTRRSRGRKQLVIKFALAAALIVTVIVGTIFVGGESSLTRFVETAQSKDISTNRTYIWGVTLKVIAGNMPLGAGLGAFGVAFTPFDTNSGLERVEQAHNDYLQVAGDAGIIGVVIGGLFLFWLFQSGIESSRTDNTYRRGVALGAFAGCLAVLVHSLFDFVLHTTAISILFLALIGLIVACGSRYTDDEEVTGLKRTKRATARISSIGSGQAGSSRLKR